MDIQTIETTRRARKISIGQLCRAADVPRSTYHRRKAAPSGGRIDTLRKLSLALSVLIDQQNVGAR